MIYTNRQVIVSATPMFEGCSLPPDKNIVHVRPCSLSLSLSPLSLSLSLSLVKEIIE